MKMTQELIKLVQDAGFKVYMRKPEDSWLYYTADARIGYLQNSRMEGPKLSTVHIPNRVTGSGFALGVQDDLDLHALISGLAHSPHWASSSEMNSVKKYEDWDAFVASSPFNKDYQLVE